MAIPRGPEARLFYRCALQRYEESVVLLEAGYTTGALYLAGYGIECILKSLVLAGVPDNESLGVLHSFRGNKGHDFEWLRTLYLTNGGARFPRDITQHFTLVNDWSTDLRYTPRVTRFDEADAFLKSAVAIIHWAYGGL